jgi:molybdenum transport protein
MITIADDELRRWLAEDVPYGDLTTHALAIGNDRGRIRFEARQAMVAACSEEAARIMTMAGANVTASVPSGTELQTAALLLAAEGPAAALHAGWRVRGLARTIGPDKVATRCRVAKSPFL